MGPEAMGQVDKGAARRLIRHILEAGIVAWPEHALKEMAKDGLTTVDCTNVMRAGAVEAGEWERGSWRYRVRTNRICVVVAFRSPEELVVVTAWRIRPR